MVISGGSGGIIGLMTTPEEIVAESLTPLAFGTDGIRGPVGEVINQESLARIVAGLAQYCASESYLRRSGKSLPVRIVVGGDCRSTSDYFTHLTATILQALGVEVLKATGYVTTPMLSAGVLAESAHAGLMITASHNPADHNGLKFIAWHGGPALPEDTLAATPYLNAEPPPLAAVPGSIEPLNPAEGYATRLVQLIDFPAIRKARLKICYDALYGAGKGYFRQIMQAQDIPAQVLHGEDDPWMGRQAPDPTEARLAELQHQVTRLGFDLGLATDGDADRFAAVDHTGRYLPPSRCLAILAHYLYTRQGARGDLARTLATSHLLDRIAATHGFRTHVTEVGFKYLGALLRTEPAILMAGEENGGFALRGHLPTKDGLLGCFLLLEAIAVSGESLATLDARITEIYGPWTSARHDLDWSAAQRTAAVAWASAQSALTLAGQQLERTHEDRAEFAAPDGTWVLVRHSGTEARLRLYAEAADPLLVSALLEELQSQLRVSP